MTDLSIIIPCYNEGIKLTNNLTTIEHFMGKTLPDISYEILVVNDGSTDHNTKIMFSNKPENIEHIRFIGYDINRGKGAAVRYGIEHACGNWILFMDADLSTDLSAIVTLMGIIKCKETQFIIGSRRHKDSILTIPQGTVRRFIGNGCVIVTKIITGIRHNDTQCGFKAIEHNLAQHIIHKQTINRWAFDVEWLYIAKQNGISVKEIPVVWANDSESKVSPVKSSIRFIIDLIKIRKNKEKYKIQKARP